MLKKKIEKFLSEITDSRDYHLIKFVVAFLFLYYIITENLLKLRILKQRLTLIKVFIRGIFKNDLIDYHYRWVKYRNA